MTFGDPTALTTLVEQGPFSCLDNGAIGALHPACPPPLYPPTGELLFLGATDEKPPAGSGYDGHGLASFCSGAEALTIEVAWGCEVDALTGVPFPAEDLGEFDRELASEDHNILPEPALFMAASPWQLEDDFTDDGEVDAPLSDQSEGWSPEADGTVDPRPQLAVCWEYPHSTIEEGIPPVPSDGPHPMTEPVLDEGVAFGAAEELLDLSSEMTTTTTWLPDETQDSSSEAIAPLSDQSEGWSPEADGTVDPRPQLAVCWEYPHSTIEEGIPPVPSDGPHPMTEPVLDEGVAFGAAEELLDLSSEMTTTTTWLPDETQDSSSEAIGGSEDEIKEPQLEISRPFISMPWWRCATPPVDEPIDSAKIPPLDDSANEPQFWLMEATMTAAPATDPAIELASDWSQDGTSEIIDSPEDEIKDLEVAETSQPDLSRPLVPMSWWRSAPLQTDEPIDSADTSLADDSQESILSVFDLVDSDAVDLAPIAGVLGSDDQPEPVALKGSVMAQVAAVAADAEPLSPDVVPVPDSAADIMSLSEVGTTGVQAPEDWRDLDPSQLHSLRFRRVN